jgi:hypothetical protein
MAGLVAGYCAWRPTLDPRNVGLIATDRESYLYVYLNATADDIFYNVMEPGYIALGVAAHPFLEFPMFLAFIAVLSVAAVGFFLVRVQLSRLAPFALLMLPGYFGFWTGVLNVTRQCIAANLMFLSLGILLGRNPPEADVHPRKRGIDRALILSLLMGLLAVSIHSSAYVVFPTICALIFIQRGARAILMLWLSAAVFFVFNSFDLGPAEFVGLEKLRSLSLVEIGPDMPLNRVDFAAITMFFIIPYFLIRKPPRALTRLALTYSIIAFPFFVFSFAPYSDRMAYYAWLFAIPLGMGYVRTVRDLTIQTVTLCSIALICAAQFTFAFYGYSPRAAFEDFIPAYYRQTPFP